MTEKNKEELKYLASKKMEVKIQKIEKNNLLYSTKMAALLNMLENYFIAYSQNKKEFLRISENVAMNNPLIDKKNVKRKVKNITNKIENESLYFYKFYKKFSKEFSQLFEDEKTNERLLDVFDSFWERNVEIKEDTLNVNENLK